MKRTLVAVVATLALAGCAAPSIEEDDRSTEPAPRTPSSGAGGAGGARGPSPDGGTLTPEPAAPPTAGEDTAEPNGQCNALENDADPVDATATMGALPAATGGALADGVYHLTAKKYYGRATPPAEKQAETIEVRGTVIEEIEIEDGVTSQKTSSFSVKGTSLEISKTCPAAEPAEVHPYSVDGDTLVVFDAVKRTGKEYTRQ